jgi:tetratricopeptide (TPR) repeat protein
VAIVVAAAALLVGGRVGRLAAQTLPGSSSAGSGSSSNSSSSSSSSSSSTPESEAPAPGTRQARIAQPNTAGSAITLETSEPLFYLATALNVCGYDAGLAESSAVRLKVRDEINQELAASAAARDARDALCLFLREHALTDPARDLAQYVSLAMYLTPPPELTTSADVTELPPDAAQVVEVLPLVRSFAEAVELNAMWVKHRPEYEGFVDTIHDPLTKMVLDTDLYLHMPESAYDGRRFLVLLEPMLAPSATNARIYASDFIVVVSPAAQPPAHVPMELIRHTYLHYVVEPLVYARSASMDPLLPLLKPVQMAPIEFSYKTDIVALLTECLIKAVEARTMDVGIAQPAKPARGDKDRADLDGYAEAMAVYDRKAEAVRRQAVELDQRQGWAMVDYFYGQLVQMEHGSVSLKDDMGQMIYGMDVDRQVGREKQIAFLPAGAGGGDPAFRDVQHAPRQPTGMNLAEMKLMKGDAAGASELAEEALKANPNDAAAHYLLGRIDLIEGDPDGALEHLTETIKLSKDPRTIAWAHIYLGRMYDIARDPEDPEKILPQREKAVAEYRAALANRDSQPDTKAEAEKGIKGPFTLPRRPGMSSDGKDATPAGADDLDPTGKAAKEAYRPTPQP